MDDLEKKLHELELGIKSNAEQSNSRMDRVNAMINGIITIMQQAIEQQKTVDTALLKEQEMNATLVKELHELREQCADQHKEIKSLNSMLHALATHHGIKIENRQE